MRTNTLIFMGGCTAMVLIALLYATPAKGGSPQAQSTPAAGEVDLPVPVKSATEAQLALQHARSAVTPWGRDPFEPTRKIEDPKPQQEPEPEEPAPEVVVVPPNPMPATLPRLYATSLRGATSWALIDRILVREGDRLASGFEVAKIEHRWVMLRWENEEVVLHVGDGR